MNLLTKRQSQQNQTLFATKPLVATKPLALLLILGVLGSFLQGCVSDNKRQLTPIRVADPKKLSSDPKEAAKVRTAIAAQYIREHKLDDADRQLQQAFDSNPNYAPAYDMMGTLLQQEGSPTNLQKAESYYRKAISLDPNFTQAHNNYGVYLSQMKRYAEALQQFEIAGSTLGYEGRPEALENLGRTALKIGQVNLAEKSFLRALDANRQSIIARTELIDLFLAQNKYQNAQMMYTDLVFLLGEKNLGSRIMLQGIRIAKAYGNAADQQRLTQQLFDLYPVSEEARQMKKWLANPNAVWN